MIVFDQELRQFSVVDETREFADMDPELAHKLWKSRYKTRSNTALKALGAAGSLAGTALPGVAGVISEVGKNKRKRARVGRYRQYIADKQAHKERMAMIAMGMDPSGVKSQDITYDRIQAADKRNKRDYKLEKRRMKYERDANKFKSGADQAYRMKQLESPK